MDIDLLKSSPPEDQMEMMMMMMQMDKLSDFCGHYTDDNIPPVNFTQGTNTSTIVGPNNFINSDAGASAFMDLPSTISFTSPPVHQEPAGFPLLSSSGSARCGNSNNNHNNNAFPTPAQKRNSMAAMREMIFRIAAMQPIHIDPESVKPPKRRNVKISKDPQSVAARHRRERISERIRILQRLVPGGTKMDTASMLDEAIHYVKFLKSQVQTLERAAANRPTSGMGFPVPMASGSYFPMGTKGFQSSAQNVQHYLDA
ncbi:hypothetical protein LguiA_006642 [Lonicera macranthoides]